MFSSSHVDIATRAEVGPRDRQEDRVRVVVSPDGSWVVAVADGLGGHPFGDEAAQAAVDALPGRIADSVEVVRAFDAANAAAWALHPELRSPDEGLSSVIALTTLVVAAWTPEGGLLVSWVGDSMAFLVPIGGGAGWHSTPHGGPMGFVSRGVGMFRASRGDSYELPVRAENCVVAGQAAFRYLLMSPSQRAVLTTWRCLSGWSEASVATGGR